jgi:hypothetical protein
MKTLFAANITRGRAPFRCKWPGCRRIANGSFTDTSAGVPYEVKVCAVHKRQIQHGGGGQLRLALNYETR